MTYQAVIGLEIHAELETSSKMFCACPVVDPLESQPNTAVCPVCAGMPGMLPVINQNAVTYALRVALALDCEIALTSFFERKNYFYPDLPKGYQITQYQQPLGSRGKLTIQTSQGERVIRVRRVHMEEDTGKSTHIDSRDEQYSLVDLNRAGVPLLEIVTEPDLHTPEEVLVFAQELRAILQYLEVNSGDMQRGVLRVEPNISVHKPENELGTRTEVKNLNSFRALERSTAYEIERQQQLLEEGGAVIQQTLGWDEDRNRTYPQRSKEEAHDYRYFPEPDLPPVVLTEVWVEEVKAALPELPSSRRIRFEKDFGLSGYDAGILTDQKTTADFFEAVLAVNFALPPKLAANWITGDLFGLMNQQGETMQTLSLPPGHLSELLQLVHERQINNHSARKVLEEMLASGKKPGKIVKEKGLVQVSDQTVLEEMVRSVVEAHPDELQAYLDGKETLENWFFGQVMRQARGQANPQVLKNILKLELGARKGQQ